MRVDITIRAGEIRPGLSPRAGIRHRLRRLVPQPGREGLPVPKHPHPDPLLPPLHRHHPSASIVELLPERAHPTADPTPRVLRAVVAVQVSRRAGHLPLHTAHVAVLGGVETGLVPGVAEVGGLEDVDLAVGGPDVGPRVGEPERRPGAAAVGGVEDGEDEEGVHLVLVGGLHAHREAARRGVRVGPGTDGRVDFQHRGVGVAGVGEVVLRRSLARDVVHVSVGGIVAGEIGEFVEEGLAGIWGGG